MPAQITTIGTPAAGGYRHQCAICQMDRIVPGERFKHICPRSVEPNEPCASCPESSLAEPPLPGLLTQAGNVTAAAARTAKQFVSGQPILRSPADKAECLTICRGGTLPNGIERKRCSWYRPSDDRCSICGCFVDEKASLVTECCPMLEWPCSDAAAAQALRDFP